MSDNKKELTNKATKNYGIFPWDFNFFDDNFWGRFGSNNKFMNTDIVETKKSYILKIDIPGVKKEEIDVDIQNGYLTVSATTCQNITDEDEEGEIVTRERHCGTYARKFYVGDVERGDVNAKLENGTLTIKLPKQVKEQNTKIDIK